MTPLFLSAFFQNTGLTIVLIGFVFYLIDRFGATLFQLGALSGIGAFVFMVGAALSRYFSRRFSPKELSLFGTTLFMGAAFSYPFLPTLAAVFWVFPIGSFAMSLFWPSLENWISLESGPDSLACGPIPPGQALKRSVVLFNLSWSPGQIIAPFLAGFLFEKERHLPIWVGILFTLPVFFLLKRFPIHLPEKNPLVSISARKPAGRFLIVCWLSNLAGWFIASIFRSLFPKYGLALGLSPTAIGAYLLLIGVGQVLFFLVLGRLSGWERSPRFLFFWEGLAIVSLLLIAWAYQPLLWAISFFLFGCFTGTAYSASLLTSLKERGLHGGGTSSHETLIGLGICLGPLVGGGLGQFYGVRAPYLASAVLLALILLVQHRLLREFVKRP